MIDHAREPRGNFQQEREALRATRAQRIAPGTDRKRVASWNGYTVSGLVRTAESLGDASVLEEAVRAMDFILNEMVDEAGQLHRVFNGGRAAVPAFLDDHAALLDASLDLYRAGAGERYLTAALHFAQEIGDRFYDADSRSVFFTAKNGEELIHRPQTDHDGATPSAAGMAAVGLLRLGQLSGLRLFNEQADAIIDGQGELMERAPHAFPTVLRAAALRVRGVSVAVVIGAPEHEASQALAARARRVLLPEDAVVCLAPDAQRPTGIAESWLTGREPVTGLPTAWLCRGTACSLPITDPGELRLSGIPG